MQRVVFVVGAGASVEFGSSMPVGISLAERIQNLMTEELDRGFDNPGPVGASLSRTTGFSQIHRVAMGRIASGITSRDSIDQFVDDCQDVPHLAEIAKLAIAHIILEAEKGTSLNIEQGMSALVFRNLRDTWLGQICRYANPNVSRQSFPQSLDGLSFVTFNYDRCIEEYLYQWAALTLAVSVNEARRLSQLVPIFHAYGKLGELHQSGSIPAVPFGTQWPHTLHVAASGLRTFCEEVGDESLVKIHDTIANADTVVFLGMAYHRQNLSILFPDGANANQRYLGSVWAMRQSQVYSVRQFLGGTATLEPLTCSDMMSRFRDDFLDNQ